MIQSSLQTAGDIATQMEEAADTIQDATNNILSTDDQTTLAVNSHAQKANQAAFDLTNLFNEAFQKSIQNIQFAAEEFERKDNEIKNEIDQSINIPNYLEDLNTYQSAKNG